MSFLSGFRRHTAVLKRNAPRSRSEFKNRVHLSLSLPDILTLIYGTSGFFIANKMRDIISTLPADMDALLAKLEKKYTDMDNGDGRTTKTKGRERTLQGALAELRL